jgi:hypothetical protein
MSDRGVHPDLVDEQAAAAPQEAHNAEGRPRRSRAVRSAPPPSPSSENGAGSGEVVGVTPDASPESGEAEGRTDQDWREAWARAESPEDAFKLLAKNLPREAIEKDETLSGLIGSRADLRARDILRQQERDRLEAAKRDAAANNDLYTLGELARQDYVQQGQQSDQVAQLQPLMEVITRVQQTLPESIQREIAGKAYGEGKTWSEGAVEYVNDVIGRLTELGWKERESALRKSILSEVNGSEPVPEREGGQPARVRVVTSEQVDAMSLREYEALFDENGQPRPGVLYRVTRGTPIQSR